MPRRTLLTEATPIVLGSNSTEQTSKQSPKLCQTYLQLRVLALFLSTILAVNLGKGLLGLGLGRYEVAQPPSAAGPDQTGEACEPAKLRNPETELRGKSRNSKRCARLAKSISQYANDFLANVSL